MKNIGFTIAGVTIDHPWATNHPLSYLVCDVYPADDTRDDWSHFCKTNGGQLREMVKIVLHHQGEMFRVTVRPAGDGKFLRSNQGLMGSGSHKPHTDNIVSSLSCGNVFLAFMPRQLLSDLAADGNSIVNIGFILAGVLAGVVNCAWDIKQIARDELEHAPLIIAFAIPGYDGRRAALDTYAQRVKSREREVTGGHGVTRGGLTTFVKWIVAKLLGGKCPFNASLIYEAMPKTSEMATQFVMTDAPREFKSLIQGYDKGSGAVVGCAEALKRIRAKAKAVLQRWNDGVAEEQDTTQKLCRAKHFEIHFKVALTLHNVQVSTLLEILTAASAEGSTLENLWTQLKPNTVITATIIHVFVRLLHGTEAPSYWNFFGIVGILHTKMRSMDHHCKHWGMLGLGISRLAAQ